MYTLNDLTKLKLEKVTDTKSKYTYFFPYIQNVLLTNINGVEEICRLMSQFSFEAQLLIFFNYNKWKTQKFRN